ncbi:uncharacterized SAM-binding protein YcdF (DUF218 family) [Staphylococcus warneri]
MSLLSIILIVLLVILLFRVSISIIRFLISVGIILLCIYLAYQGIIWLMDNYDKLIAYIQ